MIQDRINKIRNKLKPGKLDALIVSAVPNITYYTGYSNFSTQEREAFLILTLEKQYLITDARYSEAVKKQIPNFELLELSPKLPLKKILRSLVKIHQIKTVGFEIHDISFYEYQRLSPHFKKMVSLPIGQDRSIKDDPEVGVIKRACLLGDQTFKFILPKIKAGITERQLAFEMEVFIKRRGGELSFPTIVAFGPNSSIPHHQTSNKGLTGKDGFVLLDFGVKLDNYCSDMTRTVFFGPASSRQKKIYQAVLKAQQKSVEFIRQSLKNRVKIRAALIDQVARDYIQSQGLPPFRHASHGVGLEVHEGPSLSSRSKDQLKPGMAFSIEPGIYFPGFGGVRIEDLFWLKNDELIQLTQAPKELIQLPFK